VPVTGRKCSAGIIHAKTLNKGILAVINLLRFHLFRIRLNLPFVSVALNETEIKSAIIDVLKTIYDPEIPVNIYDLGLIYEVNVFPDFAVEIVMTLTSPSCPAAGTLPGEVEQKAKAVSGVKDVIIELVFEPTWNQDMMSEEAKLELGFM
jgi:FeS assembly SUF system protein